MTTRLIKTCQGPDAPSFGILHDDPDFWAFHHAPIVLDDVWHRTVRPKHELLQERNFFLNVSHIIIFRIEVDDLESDNVIGDEVSPSVYSSVCTFPDYLEFLKTRS